MLRIITYNNKNLSSSVKSACYYANKLKLFFQLYCITQFKLNCKAPVQIGSGV